MRVLLVILSFTLSAFGGVPSTAAADKLVHIVQFTDYATGSIEDWLRTKGFQLKQDANRRDRIDFDVSDNGLELEIKRRALGLMPNESVNIPDFTRVEVDWGVTKFPDGASYEQGIRNEALMVIVFMGDERRPSGSMFIPDSPHFIGLFLCHGDDKIEHPYKGAYFKKSGRYVCLDRPTKGSLVTSEFDLLTGYRTYFDREQDDDPGISGIALAVDTKKAGLGGKASAFIREIRFYR
jgi:hypothetical protein